MKNVLLFAHDDSGQESRFQAALDVVRAIDGHLSCIDISPRSVPIHEMLVREVVFFTEEPVATKAANSTRLKERLEREDVAWDWVNSVGEIASVLTAKAKLADLIVLNGHLDQAGPNLTRIATDVLLQTRRPVLLVPEKMRKPLTIAGARVMLAWDGSDEAIHALSAAAPLLRLAEEVTIVEIGDGEVRTPAEEAATYIARHGGCSTIQRLPEDEFLPCALITRAEILRTDYVVMGGFGHWRLTERLLRGNSHWMLTSARVSIFMAH